MAKRILLILLALVVIAGAAIAAFVVLNPLDDEPAVSASGAETEEDEDLGTIEIYYVLDDGTLEPEATGLTARVWDTFTRVTTMDFAAEVMTEFRVGDAPDSDTLAYVYQDTNPQYWVLAANLATSEDETQLIATLVHEYAHILTLTESEMVAGVDDCATIETSEGCAVDDAYLWQFQQQFWADYGDDAPDVDNGDDDIAYDFYLAHEDDFVSDYAATNVVEDLAESFMTFVLEEQPAEDADTVTAAKLNFFWQYPELEAIRERIRDEFASELGLGV